MLQFTRKLKHATDWNLMIVRNNKVIVKFSKRKDMVSEMNKKKSLKNANLDFRCYIEVGYYSWSSILHTHVGGLPNV